MRRALLVVVLALAGCPGSGRRNTNTLFEPRSKLSEVGAPHVAIFVRADGLYKVFLDTGQSERLTEATNAFVLDPATIVHVEDKHYVIEHAGERTVIDAVEAPNAYPDVSPDGRLLGHSDGAGEIITVDVATREVRHFLVPTQGPGPRPHLAMAFTPQSDAIVFSQDGYFRLDLASGTITPIDKLDYEIASKRPDPLDCSLRGLRLEQRPHKGRQEILLVPTASTADPEHLSGTTTRVLVSATNYDGPHGDGAITMMWKKPEPLSAELFTPTCEHFVFTLEGSVYVGNIATGKFARVAPGNAAFIK